jgi:hypothetical protein
MFKVAFAVIFSISLLGCGSGGGGDSPVAPVKNSSNTADYGVSLPRIRIDRAVGGYSEGSPYSPLNLRPGDVLRLYPEVFNNNAFQGGSTVKVRVTFDGGNPITQVMSESGIVTNSAQSGATTPALHSATDPVSTQVSYSGSAGNVGSHTAVIEVDYEGLISETNESNNTYTLIFSVTTSG